jgi:hypothetical protein
MTGEVGSENFEGTLCLLLQEFGVLGTLNPYIITLNNYIIYLIRVSIIPSRNIGCL